MSTRDMSLTPISPPREAEAAAAADPLLSTTVELSFNTSKGGAWDDRELIRASEAAMKEFHVHHPGPGSWLDKATAALAAGRALPGGDDYGTEWYTASMHEAGSSSQAQPQAAAQSTHANKKRRTQKSKTTAIDTSVPNPYAPQTARQQRATSPSYQPLSPGAEAADDEEDYDEEAEWGEGDWAAEDYYPDPEGGEEDQAYEYGGYEQDGRGYGGGQGPSLGVGVESTAGVSREDAIGYAMTAQYWAGYWMGVAQAQAQPSSYRPAQRQEPRRTANGPVTSSRRRKQKEQAGTGAEANLGLEEASNLFVTKKQFERPIVNGLRR